MNVAVLRGTLAQDPLRLTLASGRVVSNWELRCSSTEGTTLVPVQWIDPDDHVHSFESGTEVVVVGAVRKRFFRAGGATTSRTEVVGERVVKATRRVTVAKLLDEVCARIAI